MLKKPAISIDEEIYVGLILEAMEQGYQAMAADIEREQEAIEWSEGLIGKVQLGL